MSWKMLMRAVYAESDPEAVRWAGNLTQLVVGIVLAMAVVRALC